jgi:chromosome segregation ATPase
MRRALQDRDQKIDRATALIADLEQDRNRAVGRIGELESDITQVRAALQKRDAEIAGAVARMQELEGTIAQLRGIHAGVEQELASTRRQLFEQTNSFLAVTQAENERLALLIDTVQSSRFWQLKRVLGRVRRAFTA